LNLPISFGKFPVFQINIEYMANIGHI